MLHDCIQICMQLPQVQRPLQGSTIINFQAILNPSSKHNWTNPRAPENIKYQRICVDSFEKSEEQTRCRRTPSSAFTQEFRRTWSHSSSIHLFPILKSLTFADGLQERPVKHAELERHRPRNSCFRFLLLQYSLFND